MSSRRGWRWSPGALLLCLTLALALYGCSGSPAGAPHQADQKSGAECRPLTKQQAIDLLVAVSSASPARRVELTAGAARELFREEAALIAEGWPADPMGWWRQGAWLSLQLRQSGEEAEALLQHGDLHGQTVTRFRFACTGGWTLTGIGDQSTWYSPFRAAIAGQEGALTEELGIKLVNHLLDHYGTPAMRATAAGAELERGRVLAIGSRGGKGPRGMGWPGIESVLALTAEAPDRVIGRWRSREGRETGEQVLFERRRGLWQVADHTEGGRWAPAPGKPDFASLDPDLDLLGFEPGKSSALLDPVIPRGDETGDPPYLFSARKLFIAYNSRGIVQSVEARSGATRRGVQVGDPAKQVLQLYGEPREEREGILIYRSGQRTLYFLLEPKTGSDRTVAGMILEGP